MMSDKSSKRNESSGTPVGRQKIVLCVDEAVPSTLDSAVSLLNAFSSCHIMALIRLDRPRCDDGLFAFIDSLRADRKPSPRVDLFGTISEIEETTLEQLFDRRLLFRWPVVFSPAGPPSIENLPVLRRVVEYGIPVIFHVYFDDRLDGHAQEVTPFIETLMKVNLSSGFSLYPYSFRNDARGAADPSVRGWLEMLSTVYKRFSCYDVNFDPLQEIVDLSAYGGIIPALGIPRYMGVRVPPDGSARLFRQNPAESIPWLGRDRLAALSPDDLWNEFICAVKRGYLAGDRLLSTCPYREQCGGTDLACSSGGEELTDPLQCQTRRLFLELFTAQKRRLGEKS